MAIEIYGGNMIFTQDGDSCQGGIQQLDVCVEDAGGGKFYRIKTEGWSFDKVEEFTSLIEQVKSAFKCEQATDAEGQ